MHATLRSQLLQTLRTRRDTIADSWFKAVAPTSFVPLSATEVRQRFVELTEQAITLLLAEPFERRQAEAIGASLVRLHYVQPEALGKTQEVLAHRLVEGLPADQVLVLQPRLAALISGLAVGFFHQARETILAEQEQIRSALITDRKRAEERLKLFSHSLDSSIDGIAMGNLEGRITYANEAFARMFGYSREELAKKEIAYVYPEDQIPELTEALKATLEGGWRGELVGKRKDGALFPMMVTSSRVLDDEGKTIAHMASHRDITDRKRAEETLQLRNRELALLNQVSRTLNSTLDPDQVFVAILEAMRDLMGVSACSIWLIDPATGEMVCQQAAGAQSKVVRGWRLAPGEGIAGWVARHGESVIVPDTREDERHCKSVGQQIGLEIRSLLSIPLKVRQDVIGVLEAVDTEAGRFDATHLTSLEPLAASAAIAIRNARLFESVRQQGQHLRALAARLAETEESERRQIARELHDRVGQNLTALGINLNLVQTHMPEETPGLARSRLDDALALVEETVERIRDVMADLRPPMLDDYGLVATLHWYSERFASWTGASVTVHGEEPVPRLAVPAENALFRIAQEALTNVCKHAQATQVTVTVTADDEAVSLVVADDGVGFDPAQLATMDGRRGWGLVLMSERAEAVGGHYRIESRPQHGTRVIVEVAR